MGSSSPAFCALSGPAYHVRFFVILWPGPLQAPPSMALSRHESWSGLPPPSPGHVPRQGAELLSPGPRALAGSLDVCLPPPIWGVFISVSPTSFLALCLVPFWSPHKADIVSLARVPRPFRVSSRSLSFCSSVWVSSTACLPAADYVSASSSLRLNPSSTFLCSVIASIWNFLTIPIPSSISGCVHPFFSWVQ